MTYMPEPPFLREGLDKDPDVQAWWPPVRDQLAILVAVPVEIVGIISRLRDEGARSGWRLMTGVGQMMDGEHQARIDAGLAVKEQYDRAKAARERVEELIAPHLPAVRPQSAEERRRLLPLTRAALQVQGYWDVHWPRLEWAVQRARQVAAGHLDLPVVLPGWGLREVNAIIAPGDPRSRDQLESELRRRGEHWEQ